MTILGIALGSGGARGLAHIGVLEELKRLGIEPDVVAGTSMGSLIGAAYCSGHLREVHDLAVAVDVRTLLLRIMDFGMPRSGLVEGRRIQSLLDELMPEATFESLEKPFQCVATDLDTGDEIVFSSGRIQPAIRASISIPGLFTPVLHAGRYLVDGGLVNPVPVELVRNMGATTVIAVDVNQGCLARQRGKTRRRKPLRPPLSDWMKRLERELKKQPLRHVDKVLDWFKPDPSPNMIDVIGRTIHIFENQIIRIRLKMNPPNLLLAPNVGDMQVLDFHHAEEIIEAGRVCVKDHAKAILKVCGR